MVKEQKKKSRQKMIQMLSKYLFLFLFIYFAMLEIISENGKIGYYSSTQNSTY